MVRDRKFSTPQSVRAYVCICVSCMYVFPIELVGSVSLSKKKLYMYVQNIYVCIYIQENLQRKRKCVSAFCSFVENPK